MLLSDGVGIGNLYFDKAIFPTAILLLAIIRSSLPTRYISLPKMVPFRGMAVGVSVFENREFRLYIPVSASNVIVKQWDALKSVVFLGV